MISEIPFPGGFTLLGKTGISTYSIMLMIAFLVASYLAPRELHRRGLQPEAADWSLLIAVVGAIIGSKIFFVFEIWHKIWVVDTGFFNTFYYVFFTWKGMRNRWEDDPDIEGFWENLLSGGGLVFYGGFIVAFLSIWVYLRVNKYPIWRYGDAFMPSMALGYAIGRLGCLISGDGCFGHASGVYIPLITMVYGPESGGCGGTDPNMAWQLPYMCSDGVRVWNTPMIESLLSFGLFLFLMLWVRHQKFRPGMMVAMFLIFNGLARFSVEFLRLNDAVIPFFDPPMYTVDGETVQLTHHIDMRVVHPSAIYFENWHWYGLTQSQITGLVLASIGAAWVILGKLWKRDEEGDPADQGGTTDGVKKKA